MLSWHWDPSKEKIMVSRVMAMLEKGQSLPHLDSAVVYSWSPSFMMEMVAGQMSVFSRWERHLLSCTNSFECTQTYEISSLCRYVWVHTLWSSSWWLRRLNFFQIKWQTIIPVSGQLAHQGGLLELILKWHTITLVQHWFYIGKWIFKSLCQTQFSVLLL